MIFGNIKMENCSENGCESWFCQFYFRYDVSTLYACLDYEGKRESVTSRLFEIFLIKVGPISRMSNQMRPRIESYLYLNIVISAKWRSVL